MSHSFDRFIGTDTYFENPYAIWADLREHGAVLWSEARRVWLVPRYQDVHAALRDNRMLSQRPVAALLDQPETTRAQVADMQAWANLQLVFRDPPYHTRVRRIINDGFNQYTAEDLQAIVHSAVDALLTPCLDRGSIELQSEFARPLPHYVLSRMLGIPFERMQRLRHLSYELTSFITPDPCRRGDPAVAHGFWKEMVGYVEEAIADRRARPGKDLIDTLVAARACNELESDDELVASCCVLFTAGIETITMFFGSQASTG